MERTADFQLRPCHAVSDRRGRNIKAVRLCSDYTVVSLDRAFTKARGCRAAPCEANDYDGTSKLSPMLRLHSSKVLVLLFHRLVCETERPGAGRRPARQRSRRYIKAVRPCSNYTVVKFCPRFFIGSLARRWLACEMGGQVRGKAP